MEIVLAGLYFARDCYYSAAICPLVGAQQAGHHDPLGISLGVIRVS